MPVTQSRAISMELLSSLEFTYMLSEPAVCHIYCQVFLPHQLTRRNPFVVKLPEATCGISVCRPTHGAKHDNVYKTCGR
jgi:hypothetical protein